MKPINPRSGHMSFAPGKNSPWYAHLTWFVFIAIITVAAWVGDAWNFILELFKI